MEEVKAALNGTVARRKCRSQNTLEPRRRTGPMTSAVVFTGPQRRSRLAHAERRDCFPAKKSNGSCKRARNEGDA